MLIFYDSGFFLYSSPTENGLLYFITVWIIGIRLDARNAHNISQKSRYDREIFGLSD